MGYGTLEHAFWEDLDLREIGLEGRTVAAYLLTSRHSTSEGYYRLPIGYVCEDLQVERATALGYLRTLDLKNFARFDEGSQVVFVRNALRFRPPRGAKSVAAALRRASEVPINPFRTLFYDAAYQWAPEFAEALSNAGWASSPPPSEPTLFEVTPPTATPAAPARRAEPSGDGDLVERILTHAAQISVQRSLARRETIRSPEAVAQARLAKHRHQWAPMVERWLSHFVGVDPVDMAKALVDGGTASPYWQRAAFEG